MIASLAYNLSVCSSVIEFVSLQCLISGIEYSKMIFFDDCLWGDHCSQVASNCPGVVTQRTPNGLQGVEWERALNAYSQRYGSSSL